MNELSDDIAEELARGYDDPLRFVLWAFPWGESPELSIVPLPEPWASKYPGSKFGPDKWACEVLDEIGQQVRANGFDGIHAVKPIPPCGCVRARHRKKFLDGLPRDLDPRHSSELQGRGDCEYGVAVEDEDIRGNLEMVKALDHRRHVRDQGGVHRGEGGTGGLAR